MRRIRLLWIGLIVIGMGGVAPAQRGRGQTGRGAPPDQPAASTTSALEFYNFDPAAAAGQSVPDVAPIETHQKIAIDGQALAYTTRTGYLPLHNATTGQSEAHLFYTSYARDAGNEPAKRPLVFFVGGAPGAAAAWQDLGGLGPKRLSASGWMDNPSTLLAQADLVFVNPVGTAYSRPDRPDRGPGFWNTAADIASLAEFLRSFVTRYDRRTSPLFIAGEDMGTGRTAGLAAYLIEHQIPVQGVVLLSMNPSSDALAGDAQHITLLPSLVMSAWRHKKLAPELNRMSSEQIAGQARQFASREYLHALYKGDRMSADERAKAIADISRMTGVSKSFIANNDLRVTLDRFSSELLRDQQRSLSYSDSRVTGFVPTPAGGGRGRGFAAVAPIPIDFNLSNLSGQFQTAYEDYLGRELSFKSNAGGIFYLMNGGISGFTSTGNDDATLAGAFARRPSLRLFVAMNYFDLNAPFYAAEYTLAHLSVAPEVRSQNITVSHLEAGQMPYLDDKAIVKLHSDLAGFVGQAAKESIR